MTDSHLHSDKTVTPAAVPADESAAESAKSVGTTGAQRSGGRSRKAVNRAALGGGAAAIVLLLLWLGSLLPGGFGLGDGLGLGTDGGPGENQANPASEDTDSETEEKTVPGTTSTPKSISVILNGGDNFYLRDENDKTERITLAEIVELAKKVPGKIVPDRSLGAVDEKVKVFWENGDTPDAEQRKRFLEALRNAGIDKNAILDRN